MAGIEPMPSESNDWTPPLPEPNTAKGAVNRNSNRFCAESKIPNRKSKKCQHNYSGQTRRKFSVCLQLLEVWNIFLIFFYLIQRWKIVFNWNFGALIVDHRKLISSNFYYKCGTLLLNFLLIPHHRNNFFNWNFGALIVDHRNLFFEFLIPMWS